MKIIPILALCALGLAGCGAVASGNETGFLDNGRDVSFLREGSSSCPGIANSNNPIYDRYPLRCGPQTQVIPQ